MMNFLRSATIVLILLISQSALAQDPAITVGDDTGGPNDAVNADMIWAPGGSDYPGVQFDVTFDETKLSFTGCTLNAPYDTYFIKNCNFAPGFTNKIRVGLTVDVALSPVVGGTIGTMNFTIANAAAPGATPLTIDGVVLLGNPTVTLDHGQITISGPSYSSNPAAGGGTEFVFGPVVQSAALGTQNLVITNTGVGTLSGECTETLDGGDVFTITNGAYSAGAGLNDSVTVACNSAGAITTHTGTMSCTHNGGNVSSPVVYDLSCEITAGPQPAYSSTNPAANQPINLAVTEAGDPNPSQTLTITNTGAGGTTLTGTCSMLAGDAQITLESPGGFSVAQGAAGSMKTVACDASVQGNFSRTLSCTHNGSSPASPVEYAVSCVVPEAGAAVFASDPVPGPIDVDSGGDVVVDDPDPTRTLTFYNNAEPGDQFLDLHCELDGAGDAAITVSPPSPLDTSLAPQSFTQVMFSCDTEVAGSYTGTYSCWYQNGGVEGPVGDVVPAPNAVYNLSCDVREPEAQVEITPAPGTPQTKTVPPGGSTSFTFDFEEINDEGLDGNLVSCELSSGAEGFSISSPSFPTDILSGTTVPVVVDFTDPTGADSWSDTLTCMFGDSDDDDTEVSWLLTVNLGGDARFTVLKDFTDGNPGEVTVVLDCNTGLILDQDKDISEDGIGVTFVVTDYTAGNLACNVRELPVAGYSAGYDASGSESDFTDIDDPSDDAGCYWTDIQGGVENYCVITNSPDPVDVVINKEWLYSGNSGPSDVSDEFEILLICNNAEIVYGDKNCGYINAFTSEGPQSLPQNISCKWLEGSGDETFTRKVIPYDWPGGSCYAVEVNVDPAVEVDNGCSTPIAVSAGSGGSCTVTNTVFFEGIPTLSEYGMALMALLMLGMGFVAVRRIA